MNRVDFMNQLERLLQSITPAEREEALQYYNDYFDDAGSENEQEVIEALGNPARVAENIKRDLFGNGYGESETRRAQASDRALIEYGPQNDNSSAGGTAGTQSWSDADWPEKKTENHPARREGMPAWAIALLVTLLILCSPAIAGVLLGVLGTLFGALVTWYALIFAFGAVAVSLLLVLVVLVVTGVLCLFVNPWVGMAMIGGGLVCGAVGILSLMLTVAMAGIATPAIFRGIAFVFKKCRKGWRRDKGRLG